MRPLWLLAPSSPERVWNVIGRYLGFGHIAIEVDDVHEAFERLKEIAPVNAKRVGIQTPCYDTGECIDCDSPTRICNMYTIIRRMMFPGRLTLILVNEELGF